LITSVVLHWALTVLFVVCVGLYARQAIGDHGWQPRLGWSLHVLMAIAMIAMAWPARMSIPTLVYVLVFTAGALYFVYLGLFGPRIDHSFYHAVMMGAMVAMAVVMQSSAMPGMTAASSSALAGHSMPMANAASAVGSPAGSSAWEPVLCGLAAAGFMGVAVWSFLAALRGPRRPHATMLMSLGMGIAFAGIAI